MKMMATAVVIFPRKVPGPLLPKTVWLDPPKTAPMFAPFPACRSTTRIRTIQAITCTMAIRICTFSYPLNGLISDKLNERNDVQAGPADQRPVDVRLLHQVGNIFRCDASPIENGDLRRPFASIPAGDPFPDEPMYLFRLRRCSRSAGTDRPDRFVGDQEAA
jgi:hypothetical protein